MVKFKNEDMGIAQKCGDEMETEFLRWTKTMKDEGRNHHQNLNKREKKPIK